MIQTKATKIVYSDENIFSSNKNKLNKNFFFVNMEKLAFFFNTSFQQLHNWKIMEIFNFEHFSWVSIESCCYK